jgi:diacylglycerol kinase family enzyme
MLVLPGGTGNALAADLGIPATLAEAAALASGELGEVRRVDMGRSGDTWFILRMTMGLEADMVAAATRDLKDRYGWLAYAFAGLQALSAAPTVKYSIIVDGKPAESEGIAALVANSAGTGVAGSRIADDVLVSDGLLDVVIVTPADLPGLLGTAVDAMQGQQSRMMSRWRGSEIHVESDPPQPVLADGEEAGSTPVDVVVVPGAVGVVVPKDTGQSEHV